MADDFGLALQQPVLPAGGSVPIHVVAAADAYREVRVELLLVEDVKGTLGTNRTVVASAAVPTGSTIADLAIPSDLPAAYQGVRCSWHYDLRLVGDRTGPDRKEDYRVDVTPLAGPPVRRTPFFPTPGSSRPRTKRATVEGTSAGGAYGVGAFMVAASIGLGVVVVAAGLLPALIVPVVLAALGVTMLVTGYQKTKYSLDDIDVSVANTDAHLGEPIRVHVGVGARTDLEVGLVCREFRIEPRDEHRTTCTTSDLAERFQPVTGPVVEIATDPTDPGDHPGETTAIHWDVVVRASSVKPSIQKVTQRRIPIALMR